MTSNTYIFHYHLFVDWYSTEEVHQIFSEDAMVRNWLEIEAALAESQAELEIIPEWAALAIRKTVSDADIQIDGFVNEIRETGHVLVPILRFLEQQAGEAGRYIHKGATTQDIFDTAVALQLKQVYAIITRDLLTIIKRLTDLAQEHRDTVMMGRTHGVHALPTTFGFKLSVWIAELLRHLERVDQSRSRVLVGQLGGAVGTMAGFGPKAQELRRSLMERLGLNVPGISWQASRDIVAEFVLLAGLLGGTLGKMANEIATLQSTEIGELAEPSTSDTIGSSTMPHKKNPLNSEAIVAVSRLLQGLVSPALGSMHTRSERDSTTWGAEYYLVPQAASLLAAQLQKFRYIVDGLIVDKERMLQNAEWLAGIPYSENLMLQLSEILGRDRAHKIVSQVAQQALLEGRDFREMAGARNTIAQVMDDQQIRDALQANTYLGEAKAEVDRIVQRARDALHARYQPEKSNEQNN